jgi:hypothetical protein
VLFPGDSILNAGGSWGLQYPLISGCICGEHVVWCRHCGVVFGTASSDHEASDLCRTLNGLSSEVDPKVLAAIDATP